MQLIVDLGRGFSVANLTNAIELARLYAHPQIIQTLSEQFSWSHFVTFVTIKHELKRDFYRQMKLYLGWLKQCEMLEGESSPIGLILCAEKTHEHVKLLQLDKGDIRVAEQLTHQLSSALLEQKLHLAIEQARQHLDHPKTQLKIMMNLVRWIVQG